MKKNIIVSALLLLMPFFVEAQTLKGAYFMDSSVSRTKMNPAFAPRANYFQFTPIGNLSLGVTSNLELQDFLYPGANGKLNTFLHPDVSVSDFTSAIANHPNIDIDTDLTLLNFGFYTKRKSFWTVDLGLRAYVDTDIPHDLFTFLKKGTGLKGTNSFNVGNLNLYAGAALQASIGYSMDMSWLLKGLRAGIRARYIAPLAYAGINLENVRLTTSEDRWELVTEAYANAALQGLRAQVNLDTQETDLGFDLNQMLANKVLAGMGYSFDFGAEYELSIGSWFDGIALSFAFTDLGQIFYDRNAVHSFSSNGRFEWAGLENISTDTDFEGLADNLIEDAKKSLLNLTEEQTTSLWTSTMPRFYLGLEVPFLKKTMSLGLLYSARVSHSYTRHELTASYNLKPCKWFGLGLNYSFLNTTKTAGFILELTPRIGPSFTIGSDYIFWEFAPAEMVPVIGMMPTAYRLNLNFGIAFNLGSRYVREQKR